MYMIVVGAGPIGRRLVEIALSEGNDVVLIESDEELAKDASDRFDAMVLHAHISRGEILKEAGADKADILVATTSDDSANLMAMFLGSEHDIETRVSVVNEPSHKKMFEGIGVTVLMDPDVIVARHLYNLVTVPNIEELLSVPGGAIAFRVTIGPSSPLAGKTIASVREEGLLPEALLLVAVTRETETTIPSGESELNVEDEVTVFSPEPVDDALVKVFTG
jgi:trk system potassium uptake protein TrkA